MTERPAVIELRSQRGTWLFISFVLGLLGLFAFALGIGTVVANGVGIAERLVLGGGSSIAGGVLVSGAYLAFVVGRARPELRVASDGLTLHHVGLLREPLLVSREDVEEITTWNPSPGTSHPVPVQPSSEILPDFSTPIGSSNRHWNLLIVFRRERALQALPRRGLAAAAFVADRFSSYSGPSRRSVINGLVCEAEDAAEIRRAFGPWQLLVDQPSVRSLERIGPDEARRRMRKH